MADPLIDRIVQRAIQIQQIPAPTFEELERAKFVFAEFQNEKLSDVEIDEDGNVYARLPGENPEQPPLVVSAHTDTVFPAETDLTVKTVGEKIYGPGIGDNSLGVAGLFGLVWTLREQGRTLPGDVWLVANVGEEGLGDLKGMKAVFNRFGNIPSGYIILEGLALGRIYHRGLGVRRYRISVETTGGHSWVDYGNPSAIHELSLLAAQILSLRTSYRKRTSINIGNFSGGLSINSIAPYAVMELEFRSESERVLSALSRKVLDLVRFADRPGVDYQLEVIGDRPFGEIPPEHPLVQAGQAALEAQGLAAVPQIGSTDANFPLKHGAPAICIGLTSGYGAHTAGEYMDLSLLPKGMAQLVDVVIKAFEF
jgi:tripeptide aminopeptidase